MAGDVVGRRVLTVGLLVYHAWFHKRLTAPTFDNIELRICADGGASNSEDIPVGYYEIYVK